MRIIMLSCCKKKKKKKRLVASLFAVSRVANFRLSSENRKAVRCAAPMTTTTDRHQNYLNFRYISFQFPSFVFSRCQKNGFLDQQGNFSFLRPKIFIIT